MRSFAAMLVAMLAALLVMVGHTRAAQDEKKLPREGDPPIALERLVGAFDIEQKEFDGTGKLLTEAAGSLKRSLSVDGRVLEEEAEIKGKKYTSRTRVLLSYDRRLKKYISVSINNRSTFFTIVSGSYDPDKQAIVFVSEHADPETKKVTRIREVYSLEKDDEQAYEEFLTAPDTEEVKTLEIRYRRIKPQESK